MAIVDMTRESMFDRMKRAAMLDVNVYKSVEADRSATGQVAAVVAMVAVAQAIGSAGEGVQGVIGSLLAALLGWVVWSGVTYVIGDKLLGGTATWGELLRTLGFAQSPGILAVIPLVGGLIRVIVAVWILVAGIIAIRQALDFSTGKAVLTAVIGWLALAIPMMMIGLAS